jgi:signal transduction histidine kinase
MKNPFTTFSIRRKITYGFILLLVFMVGTIGLTYGVSSHIEEKVLRLELIDDLFGSILEMRRFEKNYFLYGEQSDYKEALVYNAKSASILLESREELRRIIIDAQLIQIVQTLHDYENYFQQLAGLYQSGQRQSKKAANLRENIRGLGKELTDQAEESSHRERYAVRNLLRTVRRILVAAAVSLLFLSAGLATLLGQRVVNSLKLLERYAEKISSEDFEEIRATPLEEEVRSVLNAFNRMSRILRIRQSQLVQSEKLASLGTLLSGVAHELNNPLSNISTSAQILREELDRADPEFKKGLIQQIEDQSDKARDIVRTLLEFSRATEYHPRPVALKKLFEDTVVLIRGQIPTDVSISLECPDELIVEVDKQKLQQVFLNLLKNGIDAVGQSGKLWITARLLGPKESAEELEIMIEDNGPGIPPETIKKIFDPFFSTKDVGHGSGLGLYIVHDIVARHGGRINVNSQMGQGTTFTIWLPRKQEGKNE